MKNVPAQFEDFDIEFVKLKDGIHEFKYRLDKSFFDAFENEEVSSADIETTVTLDKRNQMLQLDLKMTGVVGLPCDRCLEYINLPVDTDYMLIFKISEHENVETENSYELIHISPHEFKVNPARAIYESILLGVPMIRNCDDLENKPCNNEMLNKLNELEKSEDPEGDPRWNKLKDLLK